MHMIKTGIWGLLAGSALATAAIAGDMAASLKRVAAVPAGAEVTGLIMNGNDLFMNYQHPNKDNPGTNGKAGVGVIANIDLSGEWARPEVYEVKKLTSALGDYQLLLNAGEDGIGTINGEVSDSPDFNSYIATSENSGYLFTNWEERPGGMSRIMLTRGEDGQYSMGSKEMLDFSNVNETWINCFGTTSPWNTPLSSEELYFDDTVEWNNPDSENASGPRNLAKLLGHYPNPYDYGYIVEITDPTGTATPAKRFAMGRFSHENSVIMPDNKTAYLSDDGTGTVLFKFIADQENDLSAGTLYAAKITQNGAAGAALEDVTFGVEWIELAHGDQATINAWVREYDGISEADYGTERGYISDEDIAAWAKGQAPDDRAAFLESRKAAVAKGATGEWRKMEGININYEAAKSGESTTMYMAMSNINKTMSDSKGAIQLAQNDCGAVFQMQLDSTWTVSLIEPFVIGGPYDESQAPNACAPDNLSEPDNLIVLEDGKVLIGEDTGEHENNMLWLADHSK